MAWFAAASASFLLVLRGYVVLCPLLSPHPLMRFQSIRVAIWGRDSRVVAITMTFWLANLVGSCYGEGHSPRFVAEEVLIPPRFYSYHKGLNFFASHSIPP